MTHPGGIVDYNLLLQQWQLMLLDLNFTGVGSPGPRRRPSPSLLALKSLKRPPRICHPLLCSTQHLRSQSPSSSVTCTSTTRSQAAQCAVGKVDALSDKSFIVKPMPCIASGCAVV